MTLRMFNVHGEEVATLVEGVLEAGRHTVNCNAASHASGDCFCTPRSGSESRTVKMILLQ